MKDFKGVYFVKDPDKFCCDDARNAVKDFDLISSAQLDDVMRFYITYGKTLTGYNLEKEITYCPWCSNRLDCKSVPEEEEAGTENIAQKIFQGKDPL